MNISSDSVMLTSMLRRDNPVLVGFVADEILEVLREKQTGSEMWKVLEETCAKMRERPCELISTCSMT